MIMDVSQSESRARVSSFMPAATKSAVLVLMTREHVFTPDEIDFSMGWPCLNVGSASQYRSCVPAALGDASRSARKRFAGNGMCLQQVLSWFVFVMSNTIRRSDVVQWAPPLLPEVYEQEVPEDPSGASGAT